MGRIKDMIEMVKLIKDVAAIVRYRSKLDPLVQRLADDGTAPQELLDSWDLAKRYGNDQLAEDEKGTTNEEAFRPINWFAEELEKNFQLFPEDQRETVLTYIGMVDHAHDRMVRIEQE